jgi:hypothetical protein
MKREIPLYFAAALLALGLTPIAIPNGGQV